MNPKALFETLVRTKATEVFCMCLPTRAVKDSQVIVAALEGAPPDMKNATKGESKHAVAKLMLETLNERELRTFYVRSAVRELGTFSSFANAIGPQAILTTLRNKLMLELLVGTPSSESVQSKTVASIKNLKKSLTKKGRPPQAARQR